MMEAHPMKDAMITAYAISVGATKAGGREGGREQVEKVEGGTRGAKWHGKIEQRQHSRQTKECDMM